MEQRQNLPLLDQTEERAGERSNAVELRSFWTRCICLAVIGFALQLSANEPRSGAPAQPFPFNPGDVIVFTGGADVVAAQENGYLETLLTASYPKLEPRFRNMGWEGDTVHQQWRDLNFGTWAEQFKRVSATVIVAQFGRTESLDGARGLARFIENYNKLLDEFSRHTPRIVLVSPPPFDRSAPPLPDLAEKNPDLRLYVEATRKLARERDLFFVDLFTPFESAAEEEPWTSNGLHLSLQGHWRVAREMFLQMAPASGGVDQVQFLGEALAPETLEQLRQTILAKNRFWFDYWRPANWAFLHGDRVEQPSSRDHRDPNVRWFPAELERFVPLIQQTEERIYQLAPKALSPHETVP